MEGCDVDNLAHKKKILPTRIVILACAALGLLAGISCSRLSQDEIEEMAGPRYFSIQCTAVSELNYFQGAPSSVTVCVYQLSDRHGFDSLRDNPECMETLLACEKFDNTVVGRERVFFNPGESRNLDFERRRGVKYLAFAAGYHNSSISGSTLLVQLPPVTMRDKKRKPLIVGVLLECDKIARDRSVE